MLRVPFYILALSRLVLVVGIFGAVGYYFVSNGVGQGVSFLGIAPTCEGGGTSCAIVRCDVANGNCEKNNVAGVEIIPDRDGLGNALQAKDSSRLFVRGGRGSPEEIIVETQTERSRIQATGGQVVPLFSERLVYDGVTQKPIVSQGSVIAPDARQKDAYVFLPSESTAARLKVITASRVPNQPAGNSIIVADSIAQLSVDASGFTGRDGESVRDVLAKGVISNPNLYPSGSFGAYLARTQGRPFESVSFLDSDMSNHAQYGLQCRSDEVPVEYEIPSRSVVRAPSTAPNSSGMNITAFGQERAARAFCARKPEYTSFQSCEAEAEYTFEAECRVKPETRQARFYQHPVVYWQRAICANTADEQFRRDIVRTARVQLNVPGKKQFDGTVSRRIAFSDSYFVVDRIAGPGSESNRFDLNNGFYSPFWKQNPTYEQGVTLEVERLPAAGATPAAGIRVDNTIPISPPVTNAPTLAKPQIVYDGQVPVAHSIDYYKAPRVTYVPREATSASSATAAQWSSYRGASLFDFMNVSGDASAANTWYANSCADVRAVSLTAEGNNFNPYALMTQINSISPSPSTSDLSGLFGRLSRSYNFMDLTETGLSEDDIFQSQPVADSLSTSYARLNNVQYLWVADASGNPIAPLLAPKDYLASPHTLLAGRHIPAPLVGTPANGYSICSSSEFGSTSSSRFLCVGAFPALALDGSLVTTTVTTGTFKPFPNVQVGTNDPQPGLVCIQSPTLTCSGDPVTTPIAADFISASLVSVETSITSMSIEGGKLTANQTDLRFSLSSTGLLDGFTYPNGTKVVALSSAQYFRITNNANLWTRVNVTQSGVVAGLIASSTQPGPFSVEKLPGSKFLVDRNGMRVLKPGVQLRVSNCLAYEVIDGIDQGSSYKAKWVNISKAGYELACNQLGRQKLVPE